MKITRSSLHELVWTKPINEIAREFGVRDQHIAKACDYHDIARPRPGHWQKVGNGKKVERSELANETFLPDFLVTIPLA